MSALEMRHGRRQQIAPGVLECDTDCPHQCCNPTKIIIVHSAMTGKTREVEVRG